MKFSHLAVLALLCKTSDSFTASSNIAPRSSPALQQITTTGIPRTTGKTSLLATPKDDELPSSEEKKSRMHRLFSRTKKSLAFATLASTAAATATVLLPKSAAHASAPVMAMPKAEARDPLTDALEIHQRKMQAQAQEDLSAMNAQARKIEKEQGADARVKFEADYKAEQEKKGQERLARIQKTKKDLLDQGICPFTDVEGQRRVFEAEKGLDPAAVSGTRFYMEKELEKSRPQQSYAFKKQHHREMIKAMATDMKNRGMDPLEYFQKHQDKTAGILELPTAQAAALATKYGENIEQYGQISPPKEGELSAKELMAKNNKGDSSSQKAEAKRLKAEAKAKIAAEKAAAKQKAKELKAKAKEEAKAAKDTMKKEKEAAKAATAAAVAAASASAVGVSEAVSSAAIEAMDDAFPNSNVVENQFVEGDSSKADDGEEGTGAASGAVTSTGSEKSSKGQLPIVPIVGGVVAVGGGGYALKIVRDKAAADEAERQRQFKLLMGGMEDDEKEETSFSAPALEEVDTDVPDFDFDESPSTTPKESTSVPSSSTPAPRKKKKRGFFAKKKSDRETDIDALVSGEANAPEFATLLAKILVFGAPGRFPGVIALPGSMPMEDFDVDKACAMLTEAQNTAGLSREEAAEVFANVVNCMLIDIVDLASTSLKEKDDQKTIDAVGIVVDFMMHASSLYNSIAEGVIITPVTYGGDLRKGTLEQLFVAYATSGLKDFMSMDEDFENRVNLLQDVFQINEKKAEGLVSKAMSKKMMEMMKSGEGMEDMQKMMEGMDMEGMAGMGGMPGMGEDGEMDPEQLKQMLTQLKTMKDAGLIPDEEMKAVRDQFKEAYGQSIDELIKEADSAQGELAGQDKELLQLMKDVLEN